MKVSSIFRIYILQSISLAPPVRREWEPSGKTTATKMFRGWKLRPREKHISCNLEPYLACRLIFCRKILFIIFYQKLNACNLTIIALEWTIIYWKARGSFEHGLGPSSPLIQTHSPDVSRYSAGKFNRKPTIGSIDDFHQLQIHIIHAYNVILMLYTIYI